VTSDTVSCTCWFSVVSASPLHDIRFLRASLVFVARTLVLVKRDIARAKRNYCISGAQCGMFKLISLPRFIIEHLTGQTLHPVFPSGGTFCAFRLVSIRKCRAGSMTRTCVHCNSDKWVYNINQINVHSRRSMWKVTRRIRYGGLNGNGNTGNWRSRQKRMIGHERELPKEVKASWSKFNNVHRSIELTGR